MNIKDYCLGIVATYPGIKVIELVTKVAGELYNDSNSSSDGRADVLESVPEVLESLVKDGSLVEVEYVVPSMSYRVKSMYFPKDTGVQVRNVLPPTEPATCKPKRAMYEWRRGTTRRGLPHMSDNTSGHVNVVVLLGLGYTVGPWNPGAGALPAFKLIEEATATLPTCALSEILGM